MCRDVRVQFQGFGKLSLGAGGSSGSSLVLGREWGNGSLC